MALQDQRIVRLCERYDELNLEISELYTDFDNYHRGELRLFTISVMSVCIQAFGELPDKDMKKIADSFIEQCVAELATHMTKPDFSGVYKNSALDFQCMPNLFPIFMMPEQMET